MISNVFIDRPRLAVVIAIVITIAGALALTSLPVSQLPDIVPPQVSVSANYPGASAEVLEATVAQPLESKVIGVDKALYMKSTSGNDGTYTLTVSFALGTDADINTVNVNNRVQTALSQLPAEVQALGVTVQKKSSSILQFITLSSPEGKYDPLFMTNYATINVLDELSRTPGVGSASLFGRMNYSMRVWFDIERLSSLGMVPSDVVRAIAAQNVQAPVGRIGARPVPDDQQFQFNVQTQGRLTTPEEFGAIVLRANPDGSVLKVRDVARVELGAQNDDSLSRLNGSPSVAIGIFLSPGANALNVSDAVTAKIDQLQARMPEGLKAQIMYDSTDFVYDTIEAVIHTLIEAFVLVAVVVFVFLGNFRATLIPIIAVPVSIIGTFAALLVLGYTANTVSLLALVLAIGIVVDDAIIVLENIVRRIHDQKETPLVAAYRGTRQVGFAVIATTMVLISVFVPITFLEGDLGRLFTEFALTMAAAIFFSGVTALTLSAMMSSKILQDGHKENRIVETIDRGFKRLRRRYVRALGAALRRPVIVLGGLAALLAGTWIVYSQLPNEYTPKEDRGAFYIMVNGPEGASFDYIKAYMDEIERRLMSYTQSGEIQTMLIRAPRGFGNVASFNTGMGIIVLDEWSKRRDAQTIMNEIRGKLADLPGVRINLVMRQGFTAQSSRPVQFVIGGGTYEQLREWRDILLAKIEENNPGLIGVDWNYKETKPQLEILIDYDRAAELGVTVENVGRTLETMMGSRRATTYIDNGEEYDVILEGERDEQRTRTSMENIYVRSERSGKLIPLSALVKVSEFADATSLSRFNRVRAITIEADLAEDYTLGEALTYLETLVRDNLPDEVIVDYKGQSQDFKYSQGSMLFVFALGLIVVFLVLAGQFESYIHPLVIILTVPLAMAGGMLGLYVTGGSLNIYSQIGLLTLVGLAAKNGILIVEFANQMRDNGASFNRALMKSAQLRLRPILMTSLTAAAGAVPLFLTSGAGAETRSVIGVVVFSGVLSAAAFTVFVVPVAYSLLARRTGSPQDVARRLRAQDRQFREDQE